MVRYKDNEMNRKFIERHITGSGGCQGAVDGVGDGGGGEEAEGVDGGARGLAPRDLAVVLFTPNRDNRGHGYSYNMRNSYNLYI